RRDQSAAESVPAVGTIQGQYDGGGMGFVADQFIAHGWFSPWTPHGGDIIEGRQRHAQQRQSQRLALRINAQRPARSARQDIVENEVQSEKVRYLIANDARGIQVLEILMNR